MTDGESVMGRTECWYIYKQIGPGLERLVEKVDPLPNEPSHKTMRRAIQRAKARGLHASSCTVDSRPPGQNRYWEGHLEGRTEGEP